MSSPQIKPNTVQIPSFRIDRKIIPENSVIGTTRRKRITGSLTLNAIALPAASDGRFRYRNIRRPKSRAATANAMTAIRVG